MSRVFYNCNSHKLVFQRSLLLLFCQSINVSHSMEIVFSLLAVTGVRGEDGGDGIQFCQVGKKEGNCKRDFDSLFCFFHGLLNFFHVSRYLCFQHPAGYCHTCISAQTKQGFGQCG